MSLARIQAGKVTLFIFVNIFPFAKRDNIRYKRPLFPFNLALGYKFSKEIKPIFASLIN